MESEHLRSLDKDVYIMKDKILSDDRDSTHNAIMLAIDSKETEIISTFGDTPLLQDFPPALRSEGIASSEGTSHRPNGDSVNTGGLPTTITVKGTHGRIPTIGPERNNRAVTQLQPIAIEAKECEVEGLLARWKRGKKTW